jgi:hypothetical protein
MGIKIMDHLTARCKNLRLLRRAAIKQNFLLDVA